MLGLPGHLKMLCENFENCAQCFVGSACLFHRTRMNCAPVHSIELGAVPSPWPNMSSKCVQIIVCSPLKNTITAVCSE